MRIRALSVAAAALLACCAATGCQPKVVSKYMPVPLPIEPAPSTMITVVGIGDTPQAAREAAVQQLVHRVILPPSEPRNAPPAEFVQRLIRGYNVASTEQDLVGRYYVTLELTMSQLGQNFQEQFHQCRMENEEKTALQQKLSGEQKLREVAEERAKTAETTLEDERKENANRILVLQQEIDRLKRAIDARPQE